MPASDPSATPPGSAQQARGAQQHWAFVPIRKPELPAVAHKSWCSNPIDYFVLAGLERKKIQPSPAAAPEILMRRLYLDLTGLPPAADEVDRFCEDYQRNADRAYEELVDRLLASPHYGEMQARHWLDQARYADSNGYSIDAPRSIWKYREWVIQAFNRDLPFDQFTIEQLAGDLLPRATLDQKIATGFHRNTQINQEGGIDTEQFRIESIVDRVNTTGTVWLGLTIGCCQCHDHKFDPITQREYYQFFAFFNNCDEPTLEILTDVTRKARAELRAQIKELQATLGKLDPTNEKSIEKWERSITDQTRRQLPKQIVDIFLVAENGRNKRQKKILEDAYRRADLTRHAIGSLGSPWLAAMNVEIFRRRQELVHRLELLLKQEPAITTTMIVSERSQPRTTTILLGGDFLRRGAIVQPGTPVVLPLYKRNPRTRLDLARWLVSPENPLTARVTVNRYWGQLFGMGLVETDNDFGTQGSRPSHPELLDWLASEFRTGGWSIKKIQKTIVMSSTYRQSSHARKDLEVVDPRNQLLARQNRFRVSAEIVRDLCLFTSGLLNPTVGGPSIFPPQPEGVYRFTQIDRAWKTSPAPECYRRGMYTWFWRSAPHPALMVFDAPDASSSCTRRNRTNTPLQALTLLNDSGFYEYAQALADRILSQPDVSDKVRIENLFRICLSRRPNPVESRRLLDFRASCAQSFREHRAEARQLLHTRPDRGGDQLIDHASWIMLARVLMNLDEFITRE